MMEAMMQAEPRPKPTAQASAAKTSAPKAAPKVKATLLLTPEADVRLHVHAKLMGLDRSDLVNQLILEGCRRFVVSDRGADRARAADQVTTASEEVSAS